MSEKPLGGVFALADRSPDASLPPFAIDGATAFVNARSALAFAVRQLGCRRVWLPSYVCGAIANVAEEVRYYAVDAKLRLASDLGEVRGGDCVVVVHYFGFRADSHAITLAHSRGAKVIEDAAQAPFVGRHPESDCIVYSPRKFVGVPDGGVAVWNAQVPTPPLAPPPDQWWLGAFLATLLRRDFDRGAAGREWFPTFQESEREAPQGDYRMSDVSAAMLEHAFDWKGIRRRRIDNYRALLARLGDAALFPELPDDTVPLGFPVRVPNRAEVLERLYAADIYPAVHWPLPHVPPHFGESHRLAEELMTLPCDQRYDGADMTRMADCFARSQP